ncbi:MAG: T9SS type A sorting domain-containing protein [Prevotellaceae bacterium]|nr:T9SS type A sorting domain-containing protein [Prevotellaceae bacterium]
MYSIPNPVYSTLQVARASGAPTFSSPYGHYNVINMMGNVVASGSINLNASSFSVNLSSKPAGIYVIYIYRDSPTTILQTHTFTLSVPL